MSSIAYLKPNILKKFLAFRPVNHIAEYIKRLANDYAAAIQEISQSARNRPIRSFVYSAACLGLFATVYFCPTKKQYQSDLVDACVDIWEVPAAIRNPQSAAHVHGRIALYFSQKLRVTGFGLFSIAWRDDRTEDCCLFAESCKYSHPANGGGNFTSFIRLFLFDRPAENGLNRLQHIAADRILDVGFFGRWWYLRRIMEDYDINPDEWVPSHYSEATEVV